MTDPNPPSPTGNAHDAHDAHADASDRAWFRAHLDPVVGADSSTDDLDARWQDLADAANRGATPLPLGSPRRRRPAVFLGAAAAVLALVAVAAVLTATRDDDTVEPLVTGAEQPTGWYVPVGLPDGWQLDSAEAYPGPKACKRQGVQWSDPAKDRSVSLSFNACGRAPTDKDVPDLQIPGAPPELNPRSELHEVDLGDGITATGIRQIATDSSAIDVRSLSWNSGGGAWTVQGLGIGYDGLVAVAKRLAADPGRSDIGIDGLDAVDRWSAPERDHTPQVQVNLVNPAGLRASYYLSLPGDGEHAAISAVLVPTTVEGQPNRVFRYDTATFWAGRYGGSWPGADLMIYRWTSGPTDPEHLISDAGLEQLIAALRPATTDEWRTFLGTATGTASPALLDAPSLAALAETDIPRPGEPTDPPPTTTTTTTTAPTTTAPTATTTTPPSSGRVVSEPGTATPREGETRAYRGFTELDGLELRLELASNVVRPLQATGGVVIAHNTTGHDIAITDCTRGLSSWGLVPADDPERAVPQRMVIDCDSSSQATIAAGETVHLPMSWWGGSGFVARHAKPGTGGGRFLGTLPAGSYLAVFEVEGASTVVRMSVPVTVPTQPDGCAVSDTEAETWFTRPFDDTAKADATAAGDTLVAGSVDGVPQGLQWKLDCHRIQADVLDGKIVGIVRG